MITRVYYHSTHGNTAKVAAAMATAAGNEARDIAENAEMEHTDLLLLGDGIHKGKADPATLRFIEGIDPEKVKNAALFVTYGFSKKGAEELRAALARKGVPVFEQIYYCKGKSGMFNGKHPDDRDLSNAVLFADHAIRVVKKSLPKT